MGESRYSLEEAFPATAHARALAEAAGDQTLTLEEEVVEINRQIEKLGEADENEAIQMLNAELQAEEEAKRTEEAKKREATKAKEETPKEGDGSPRAAEEKPDAGGEAAGRELEALRVRAAELDDRLRRKGLRKAERNKIAEELAGVQARMQELSGGNLVLFSRGDGAQGRPALSPTKAALRDRLLLKIAQTAGIRIVRERSAQILGSARNAEVRRRLGGYMGESRYSLEEAFPATEAERDGIEREAKAKGTWLKAPNGQDTKLTPKQWVTVRTRAFKKWFGDWEKRARIQKLIDAPSISLSEYAGQYELTRDSARSWIKNNIEGKSFTIDDTGDVVRIGKVGRKKVTSHGYENDVHLKSIASIPAMLKNATFIDESPKEKTGARYRSFRYYVVGVKMDGVDYTAKLVVGVASDGSLYYDHSLTQIEKGVLSSLALENQPRTQDHQNAPDGIKDTRLFSLLQAQSSLVVDENGEPLVVWHGSPSDFNEFSLRYLGTNGTAEGYGFYFTDRRAVAESYARGTEAQRHHGANGRLFEAFLNIAKPLSNERVTMTREEFRRFLRELSRQTDADGNPLELLSNYGDAAYEGENAVMREAERLEYDGNDNDVDIVHSIINAVGDKETVFRVLRSTTGFDGIVADDPKWGGDQTVYVAFSPTQIKSATENVGTFDAGNPDIRYSLSMSEQAAWGKVLDDYEAGRLEASRSVTVLPRTPAVLQRCGAANLPLRISVGTLNKVVRGKHSVPVRELRGLLTNLDNPIAVFRSRTQADSLVVLTELRDEANGHNAVVAVRLDAKESGGHEINAIASIYGRSAFQVDGFLRDGLALYVHTQKIRAYYRTSQGLQLPPEATKRGSSSLLTQDDFAQDELGVVKVNNKILRNAAGLVYGYWDEGSGELHLNEDFADFDTPLHEWAHVWLSWVRKADGRKYASSVAFDFAENFLQAANRGEGIVVPADGAHDGEVSRAGAEHGGQPRFVEPADGDGGTRRGVDHRAHGLQAQRRIGNFLGRRGVDGADADVVRRGGSCGNCLRERVRGESENLQRREAFPRGGQRHVVLPEMHAVGLRFRGDFRIVVHDEERARSRSDAANVFRGFDDTFPRRALHAQLNETQACAHGCVRAGFITRRGIRDDEVKAEGIFHKEKKKKRGSAGIARGFPWRSRRRRFSALQIFGDDARELASAFEHAAENRPHAEAALYVVRRHARGVKPGEQAFRIFDGRAFAVFHPHGFFAENAAGGRIDFHAGLVHGLLNDFARVSRAVDDGARRDDDGVDVHVEPPHRVPVDDDAGNHAVVENDVLDADCVENDRSRLARAENQPRRHFDGIERLVAVPERNRRDVEVVKNFRGVVLHDDFVHQHAAAPNAAAGRELAFVNGDFETRLREVARGDEPARSRADDGDVHREMAFELFEKRAHDGARNLFFHDHGFLLSLLFFCVESKMDCRETAPAGTRFPRSAAGGGFLFPRRDRTEKKRTQGYARSRRSARRKKKTCRPAPELVSSSFPFQFNHQIKVSYAADLSSFQNLPRPQVRLPCPHEDPRRPQGHRQPSRAGAQAPRRLSGFLAREMRFPAAHRLRLQADFTRLREQGSRYNCGPFVVNAAPPDAAAAPRAFPRFAVIASKKAVSNRAVRRNAAKRVFREIFRKNAGAFPPGWDVIVIARRGFEKVPFAQLEARYLEAARRIVARFRGNAGKRGAA